MNLRILKQILSMTRYAFWGIVLQATLANMIMAGSVGSAQTVSINQVYLTVNAGNKVADVFSEIERQTDFRFAYKNDELVEQNADLTSSNNESLGNVLRQISKSTNLKFRRVNDLILVSKKPQSKKVDRRAVMVEETVNVKGTITDQDTGETLPGVNVVVKGTTAGTVTDMDGQYTIEAEAGATIVFSYIGYLSQEVTIGSQSVIDVLLVVDAKQLEEVVVVGYGTQKKAHLTGSIASVNNKDINQSASTNVTNGLVGRVPGLVGIQQSGQPGEDVTPFYIRGQNSLNDGSTPLILVDGVQRNMSQLNGLDIESFTVLKDASAAAVYGVRAANGVILVTTKRGQLNQAPTVSYSGSVNFATPTVLPEMAGSYDFTRLFNEANANDGNPAAYTDAEIEAYRNGSDRELYPDTDWISAGLKDRQTTTSHSLGVQGGGERFRYYIGTGILDTEGLVANVGFKRQNFLANLDFDVTENLAIKLDLQGRHEERTAPGSGGGDAPSIMGNFYSMWPVYKDRYSNGFWGRGRNGNNPIQQMYESGFSEDNRDIYTSTIGFEYKLPIDGLKIVGNYSFDRGNQHSKVFEKPLTSYQMTGYDANNEPVFDKSSAGQITLQESMIIQNLNLYETSLNYEKEFGKHLIKALALYSQQETNTSFISAGRINFASDQIAQLSAGSANKDDQNNNGGEDITRRLGFVGRVNYVFDNKYLIEASLRYEGSEKFSEDERMGVFPAVSAGWNIAEENFLSGVNWLTQLKVRGSWGKLGFDGIPPFRFLSFYQSGAGYVFGGASPVAASSLVSGAIPDPTATWEKSTTSNIGMNADFLDGKFGLEADLFWRNTTDILVPDEGEIPATIGATLPDQNIGEVNSKGWEVSLTHRNKIGPVDVNANINYTQNSNEIIATSEPATLRPEWSQIGRSVGTGLLYDAIGLFQTQEEIDNSPVQRTGGNQPGDIKYRDVDGNGVINEDDRVRMDMNTIPRKVLGVILGANYKGFSLNLRFQGQFDFKTYLNSTVTKAFIDGAPLPTWIRDDHWTEDNRGASYPRLSAERDGSRDAASDFWLKNSSFVRLKEIGLTYNLPGDLVNRLRMQRMSVFVKGFNLITWSDLDIVDPSAPSGEGASFYPVMKNYEMGINITL
ncbi:SusC/RagA family TonB-linked outer membrane protein [Reichenbachiella sp.]